MIDNIKLLAYIEDESFELLDSGFISIGELILYPCFCERTGIIQKHSAIHNGLKFTLQDNQFSVSNSLHKFYHGNNYCDFSYTELQQAITKLERITEVSSNLFQIKKLEFSVNVSCEQPGYKYLPSFSHYKGKEFSKMKSRAFWYGIKYVLTEYSVKIYDKTQMVKKTKGIQLVDNILRFESQYNRPRSVPAVSKLSHLRNKKNLELLCNKLIQQIGALQCIGNEDFSSVSSRDRELYFAGMSSRFWEIENEYNRNTAKHKRKRLKAARHKISANDLAIEFQKLVKSKFDSLINA